MFFQEILLSHFKQNNITCSNHEIFNNILFKTIYLVCGYQK